MKRNNFKKLKDLLINRDISNDKFSIDCDSFEAYGFFYGEPCIIRLHNKKSPYLKGNYFFFTMSYQDSEFVLLHENSFGIFQKNSIKKLIKKLTLQSTDVIIKNSDIKTFEKILTDITREKYL